MISPVCFYLIIKTNKAGQVLPHMQAYICIVSYSHGWWPSVSLDEASTSRRRPTKIDKETDWLVWGREVVDPCEACIVSLLGQDIDVHALMPCEACLVSAGH